MQDKPSETPQIKVNRWRRFADWDERPLRLDRFAVEDAENGFAAFTSPNDPKPGLEIANGTVKSMDGIAAADFDMIDLFIARHHHRSRDRSRGDGDAIAARSRACWSTSTCRAPSWCGWRMA